MTIFLAESDVVRYKCETCGLDILDVVPRFRVQVTVSDDSACASFLLFDRDVYNIVDKSAYVLKEAEAKNDVESSMAENVVIVETKEVNAIPPHGKCGIDEVDKDKGALSVTSRNKKRVI
ncbi:hypothetical protein CTI12_AA024560 [Artemisia annua]|uniref:Replication factor A C-terminal domain-containing protein n=1 Tax=Artemisia annua TaxID=35608 RepID=A0A2U1QJ13_ARTAN|nr:hypothetical protein CTI12_AA024560 [Artemisia annua]